MLEIIRGATKKEESTADLIRALQDIFVNPTTKEGLLFIGYPILNGLILDAALVTQEHGMVAFDLIEEKSAESRASERDTIYANTQARLIQHEGLRDKRDLAVKISVFTYAPLVTAPSETSTEFIRDTEDLRSGLDGVKDKSNEVYFRDLIAVIQAVTKLSSQKPRYTTIANSRGSKLKDVESKIANLDSRQNQAVIETAAGPQRIRGLAGSGKTIILALKAAYLHTRYPEWNIAITFNVRSLKEQFADLVTKFTIEQKKEDPDWEKVKILQSWGSHASTGIYYEFCVMNGVEPLDFQTAKARAPKNLTPLGYVSLVALKQVADKQVPAVQKYDAILIDEAQDLSPAFLKLCFAFLKPPGRIIYAYDELQNLSMVKMESPSKLFGVPFDNEDDAPLQDIILQKCYRNSRPVLITAHGLGFGTTRNEGLVQMFDEPSLWKEIGYEIEDGDLTAGSAVTLNRPRSSSPEFLEDHSETNDLIQFRIFNSIDEESTWVAEEIQKNLKEDELTTRDIIVVTLNAMTADEDTSALRAKLLDLGINSHLAGVTTSSDQFFKPDSVAVTGIYRAKGNEAAMVYVINSEYAFGGSELIKKRNILFSAITRSKAWVRIVGLGASMEGLAKEFEQIRDAGFKLKFIYPSKEDMEKLRVINRDLTESQKRRQKKSLEEAKKLAENLASGDLRLEDIDAETREQLNIHFNEKKK